MKKLLMYSQYFYPEVASLGQLMTDLCIELQNNFDITVICAAPCYTGKIDEHYKGKRLHFESHEKIKLIRVRVTEFDKQNKISRIRHILSFFVNSVIATFKAGRQDVVFVSSQPPILAGILGVIGKCIKNAKLVYNIQDFNPEQTKAVNYTKLKVILKIAQWLDKRSCRKSDLVIVVGQDMQKTLEKRFNGQDTPNNTVINNWIDEKVIYPLPKDQPQVVAFKKEHGMNDKFIIMYSGNIGLFYDLDNIIKVVERLKVYDDIAFAFVGDGAVKSSLVDYCVANDMKNVYFIPYQDKDKLIYSLNAADVHLVMNLKGIKGISVPSKIYGVMATNVPILGILEEDSEAYGIINDSNCGIVCEPGDYEGIHLKLRQIINEKRSFVENHSTGRKYLEERFTKEKSMAKYYEVLNSLILPKS